MKHKPPSTENAIEMATRCFEAYGSDIAKWPAENREAYGAAAQLDELSQAREDAMQLDDYLSEATTPKASHDLQNRIFAAIDLPQQGRATSGFFGFFASWQIIPTSALAGVGACIGALGLVSGFMTANMQYDQQTEYVVAENEPPEYEAYVYLEYSGDIFADDQLGEIQ